ncbi:MAG: enterochelin esterase [Pirellulales bacterium]
MKPAFANLARVKLLALACGILAAQWAIAAEEPPPPKFDSPRIAQLAAALAAGDTGAATEAFWTEIKVKKTPLVESIDGGADHVWLTFLWRGDDSTRSVVLVGGAALGHPTENRLKQLPNSDVWYRTLRMRNDLRTTYRLLVNDPRIEGDEPAEGQGVTSRPDPLNPRRQIAGSLIELANAPPQPWIQANEQAPRGTLEGKKFKSEILGNERQISVYRPANYDPAAAPYPLVILFDWDAYTLFVPTPTILNNLIHAGQIPPVVTLLVGNAPNARNTELPCNETFARFLAEELLPAVRKEHHVTTDPRQVVVGGSSYGGLAASYFAWRYPEVAGNVLSQSGSYWWFPELEKANGDPAVEREWLTRQFATSPKKVVRFFLEAGLRESLLVDNRHFRDVLSAKGYEIVAYSEYNGGHDYCCWRGSLADGLMALLGKAKSDAPAAAAPDAAPSNAVDSPTAASP